MDVFYLSGYKNRNNQANVKITENTPDAWTFTPSVIKEYNLKRMSQIGRNGAHLFFYINEENPTRVGRIDKSIYKHKLIPYDVCIIKDGKNIIQRGYDVRKIELERHGHVISPRILLPSIPLYVFLSVDGCGYVSDITHFFNHQHQHLWDVGDNCDGEYIPVYCQRFSNSSLIFVFENKLFDIEHNSLVEYYMLNHKFLEKYENVYFNENVYMHGGLRMVIR